MLLQEFCQATLITSVKFDLEDKNLELVQYIHINMKGFVLLVVSPERRGLLDTTDWSFVSLKNLVDISYL